MGPCSGSHGDAAVLAVDVVIHLNTFPGQLMKNATLALSEQGLRTQLTCWQAVEGDILARCANLATSFRANWFRSDSKAHLTLTLPKELFCYVTHFCVTFICKADRINGIGLSAQFILCYYRPITVASRAV